MGSIYARPGTTHLWVKYRAADGRLVRESTETSDRKAAQRFLDLRVGKAAEGIALPPRLDRITYAELEADLLAFYETTGRYKHLADAKRRLAHVRRFFGGSRAVSITAERVTLYAAQRQLETTHIVAKRNEKGQVVERCRVTAATINRELALLRRMLRLAAKRRKLLSVPAIELLREAPARAGFVDEGQYRTLLRHVAEDLQGALAIAFTFGWRLRSEVLPPALDDLDLEAMTMRPRPGSTKNREGRVVYLPPALAELLRAQVARVKALQREGRIVTALFPHLDGPHIGQPRHNLRKAWRAACRAAGLPGLLVHDLRRSAVRSMERAGVPRSVAMKLTGHKTESVYRRYAIVSDADLREASAMLATNGQGTVLGTVKPIARKTRAVSA